LPKDFGGKSESAFFANPIGTGPFVLKSFEKGAGVVLARNKNYWQPGKPYLDGVSFSYIPEDNQRVAQLKGGEVEVIFTPHLVPMDRGILATIYAVPRETVSEHDLMDLYRAFYAGCPFMRVVDHLPSTKDSAFTNFCDITVRVVRGKVLVIACLDNLVKGASGVAVQNFNLMFGYPETTALY